MNAHRSKHPHVGLPAQRATMATGGEQLSTQLGDVVLDGANDDDVFEGTVVSSGGVQGAPASSTEQEAAVAAAASILPADPVARAHALIDDDRLLQAARVIRDAGVTVPPFVTRTPAAMKAAASAKRQPESKDARLSRYMAKAAAMETLVKSLKSDAGNPASGWTIQGERMGAREISIYYRFAGPPLATLSINNNKSHPGPLSQLNFGISLLEAGITQWAHAV